VVLSIGESLPPLPLTMPFQRAAHASLAQKRYGRVAEIIDRFYRIALRKLTMTFMRYTGW
jgi:hypothetical protein